MPLAKVTSKGQVTIPSEVRKMLNIEEGDSLLFDSSSKDGATMRVIKSRSLTDFRGVLRSKKRWPGKEKARKIVGHYLGRQNQRTKD